MQHVNELKVLRKRAMLYFDDGRTVAEFLKENEVVLILEAHYHHSDVGITSFTALTRYGFRFIMDYDLK